MRAVGGGWRAEGIRGSDGWVCREVSLVSREVAMAQARAWSAEGWMGYGCAWGPGGERFWFRNGSELWGQPELALACRPMQRAGVLQKVAKVAKATGVAANRRAA